MRHVILRSLIRAIRAGHASHARVYRERDECWYTDDALEAVGDPPRPITDREAVLFIQAGARDERGQD